MSEAIDAIAEEIMPDAITAQVAKLGRLGELHRPMSNIPGENEPACPQCMGGIFSRDPAAARPCGCWGTLQPICTTCAHRFENGHWARDIWPCETWKALIELLNAMTPTPHSTEPRIQGGEK